MNSFSTETMIDEASQRGGISKRHLFSGAAAILAASAIATAARAGTAPVGEPGSIEAVWREYRRRVDAIDAWSKRTGRDVPIELADWSDEPLFEAGKIAPRSEADWAALLLVAMTLAPYYEAGDVMDEVEERCCAFGLPSPEFSF